MILPTLFFLFFLAEFLECPVNFLKPLELCKKGEFEQLFELYNFTNNSKLKISGYEPSDYLHDDVLMETTHQNEVELFRPIHYAAAHGNLRAVRKFVQTYKCFDSKTSDSSLGTTPLMLACFYGHFDVAYYYIHELKCGSGYLYKLLVLASSIGNSYQPKVRVCSSNSAPPKAQFNLVDAVGRDHLKIIMFMLDCFKGQILSIPYSVVTLALLSGSFEVVEQLERVKSCRSTLLQHPGRAILFSQGNCEIIEKIIMLYKIPITCKLVVSVLNFASIEVIALLFRLCTSPIIFERVGGPKNKCLFFCAIEWILADKPVNREGLKNIILEFGEQSDSNGQTLLHYACSDESQFNVSIAKLLLDHRPHLRNVLDNNQQLPLHIACSFYNNIEFIDLLSENCDNIDAKDNDGNTPLHLACISRQKKIAKHLVLQKRSSLLLKNKTGFAPMSECHRYLYNCNLDDFSLGDANAKYADGNTLLHYACMNADLHLIRYLTGKQNVSIDEKNSVGELPLHCLLSALQYNRRNDIQLKDIQALSSQNISEACNSNGDSLVHCLCKYGERIRFSIDFLHQVLKYFVLDLKAPIDMTDSKGTIPLHHSVSSNCTPTMLDLVCNDRLINRQDDLGNTALHIACKYGHRDRFSPIKYLIKEKHASICVYNSSGELPLHIYFACWFISVAELAFLLNDDTIDVNIPDSDGNSLLHLACMRHSKEVIIYLVKSKGAFVNIQNKKGELPLHLILKRKFKSLYVINLLITEANLFMQDNDGNTPLHTAWLHHFSQINDACNSQHFSNDSNRCRNPCISLICIAVDLIFLTTFTTMNQMKIRESAFDVLKIKNNNDSLPLQTLLNYGSSSDLIRFKTLFSLDHCRYNKILCSNLCLNPIVTRNNLRLDILHVLANSDNVKVNDSDGRSILHVVSNYIDREHVLLARLESMSFLRDIVNRQDDSGKTALHLACRSCYDEEYIKFLKGINCTHNIKDNDGNIPLHDCAAGGYVPDSLPISNEDLHTFNKKRLTPLHVAIKSKNMHAAENLLNKHSQLCEKKVGSCNISESLLDLIVEVICDFLSVKVQFKWSYMEQLVISLRLLLYFFEEQVTVQPSDKFRQLIFWLAVTEVCFVETEKYIEDNEVKFCMKNVSLKHAPFSEINQTNLMHAAAWNGRIDILKYMIEEEHYDIYSIDQNGYGVLAYACHAVQCGYLDEFKNDQISKSCIVYLIESGCSIFSQVDHYSLLEFACQKEDLDLFKILTCSCEAIDSQDSEGRTPLMCLVEINGSKYSKQNDMLPEEAQAEQKKRGLSFMIEAMTYLIKHCACDQTICGTSGSTVLHLACRHNLPSKLILLIDFVSLLQNHKLSVLEISIQYNNFDTFLLLYKADVTFSNSEKIILLEKALFCKKLQMLHTILESISIYSIFTTVVDESSSSSLLKYCVGHAHEFEINNQYLQFYNNAIDFSGNTVLHKWCQYSIVQNLTKLSKIFLGSQNRSGDTPLHICCKEKNWLLLSDLLYNKEFVGKDTALSTKNCDNDYPLSIALKTFTDCPAALSELSILFHLTEATTRRFCRMQKHCFGNLLHLACQYSNPHSMKIIQHLLYHGARLDCCDELERVPLHYAVNISLDLVKVCALPTIVDKQDSEKNTPLHIACTYGMTEIIQYLLLMK